MLECRREREGDKGIEAARKLQEWVRHGGKHGRMEGHVDTKWKIVKGRKMNLVSILTGHITVPL